MSALGAFSAKVAAGFALVLVLVGGAALLSVRRLVDASHTREAAFNAHVAGLIEAERLRSAAESTMAAGRGYLLTRNPMFLDRLREAEAAFDHRLHTVSHTVSTLRTHEEAAPSPAAQLRDELLAQLDERARGYEAAQRGLLLAPSRNAEVAETRARFDAEVLPRRRLLDAALDNFVARQERRVEQTHEWARLEARRAAGTVTMALSLVVLAGAAFAFVVGRHLARAYHREGASLRRAERAVADRDELLGIVAHDLRSPLNAIMMSAALIRRTRPDERVERRADSIESVAKRMDCLIRSLLDTASLEAGRLSMRPKPQNAAALTREATEMLAIVAASSSITLDCRSDDEELGVLADRERLMQVLINLVTNALKFTPAGGRVSIGFAQRGSQVQFSISDTGPGIADDQIGHVFERFWKDQRNPGGGSGLGLYISKAIVEAHAGRIWVESLPGQGSTFHFTLPLAVIAAPTREEIAPEPDVAAC